MTGRSGKIELWTAWGAFLVLLATYWTTVAPTVSYWDCPEYVSAAWLLEVGHPPGNPTWMLVERIVTLFAPSGEYAALAVNLSSGLFTAFAAFFLARVIFGAAIWVLRARRPSRTSNDLLAAGGALCGTLIFGWCDSVWFSAVEAEVYAMSLFMTSLCLWLMVKWAFTRSRPASWRLLILIAYLFGLSIGIHQLNLLLIPALAMIWAFKRGVRRLDSLSLIGILSLVAVGCILMGMMPSTIALAAELEFFAVNTLHLPFLSGVAAYVALLAAALLLALCVTARSSNRGVMAAAVFPALFMSGIFIFSRQFAIGAAISAIAASLLVRTDNFRARRLNLCIWMLAMLLTGYSSYALIPVRGAIPSPANAQRPGEPFSFAAYQSREQYGSKPLLFGRTPYSKMMLREDYDSVTGKPSYSSYKLLDGNPVIVPDIDSGRYAVVGARHLPLYTPELNMWFPRLTESSDYDLDCYSDWIGADTSTMTRLRVSEAYDSLGRAVTKADAAGKRPDVWSFRPTYLQSAQWFTVYQSGYMYWRYLLWNFSGRQNDIPAQGEVQHGNFITGIPPVDSAMLGPQDMLPDYAGRDNPGHNVYWALPLLLGVAGALWLVRAGRRGKGVFGIVTVIFVMTGLAIVVYLNQGPGEPRERDYSFLGSWMAFCIWAGFGAIALTRLFRRTWVMIFPLALAVWVGIENFDDHDRSGRYVARNIAVDVIESLEPNAILFIDGDNGTFPLWYIQEVEQRRPDVRLVNLSYLSVPPYAEALTRRWRDSAPLRLSLPADSILRGAYRSRRIGRGRDAFARVPLPSGDSATISLKNLSVNGFTLNAQRRILLDILKCNGASRPIYWLRSIPSSARMGGDSVTSMWLFGYRYGLFDKEYTDSTLAAAVDIVRAPNPEGKQVYMDRTPAAQVGAHRAALVFAAERLLHDGKTAGALRAIAKADGAMGYHPLSYTSMRRYRPEGDTILATRNELGAIMIEASDTLNVLAGRIADTMRKAHIRALAAELRARGITHRNANRRKFREWELYRRSLPPRLRNKMAPII